MKMNPTKIAGLALSVLGAAISIATSALDDKKRDETIKEEVAKAVSDLTKKES